jgi:thiamine-monophosphate kinase
MPNESDIIRRLQAAFSMDVEPAPAKAGGIGDDAAVLPLNAMECYVVSKDILVENRHFRRSHGDAASLARKALHVNLSDIAAMGAKPLFVLLGIALPPTLAENWIDEFLTGFVEACQQQDVQLIGGDTTASERDLFISVTVIGRGAKAHLKFRHGAKTGDAACLAGAIGEAHAGLAALERKAEGLDVVKAKFLSPAALVAEGLWLGQQPGVTAMMDVSDGLYVDLGRLLQSSGVGASVDLESLKPSAPLAEACRQLRLDARECMLAGGEDYALLLTVADEAYGQVAQEFAKRFGYALVKIGAVTASGALELREGGKLIPFIYRRFSHFGEAD